MINMDSNRAFINKAKAMQAAKGIQRYYALAKPFPSETVSNQADQSLVQYNNMDRQFAWNSPLLLSSSNFTKNNLSDALVFEAGEQSIHQIEGLMKLRAALISIQDCSMSQNIVSGTPVLGNRSQNPDEEFLTAQSILKISDSEMEIGGSEFVENRGSHMAIFRRTTLNLTEVHMIGNDMQTDILNGISMGIVASKTTFQDNVAGGHVWNTSMTALNTSELVLSNNTVQGDSTFRLYSVNPTMTEVINVQRQMSNRCNSSKFIMTVST